MTQRPGAVPQVLASSRLVLYFPVLLHKARADLSGQAAKYPGEDFWRALGRTLMANRAG